MTTERALALAHGYAWAYEDHTGNEVPADDSPNPEHKRGWELFARAYAAAQDDYNNERRGFGPLPVKEAFARWLETGGRTIERA